MPTYKVSIVETVAFRERFPSKKKIERQRAREGRREEDGLNRVLRDEQTHFM